jgi:ribosomal protein S24E
MQLKIIDEKNMELLHRKELICELTFDQATPKTEEVKKSLASQKKANEELVVIKNVQNFYGNTKALVKAFIYDKPENLKKIEVINKRKKKEKVEAPTK